MQKTLDHLNFIIKHSGETQNHLDSKDLNQIQYFCIGMLERLGGSSLAVRELLPKINANPTLDFSCGLILRSFLLDYLVIVILYKIIYENDLEKREFEEAKKKVETFCNECLSDGLPQTLTYIKAAVEAKILTPEKEKEIYNNMARNYKIFFEPHDADGTLPILKNKKQINARELFKEIANHPDISNLAIVYDLYVYYSKYDHFGIMYFDIIREKHTDKLAKISKAIELQIAAQSLLHFALRLYSNNDSFLESQSNIAADYLMTKVVEE